MVERLRLRRLRWGDAADTAAVAERFGRFDVVLGADVVYVEEAVPQLFSTVLQLLSPSPQVTTSSSPKSSTGGDQGKWAIQIGILELHCKVSNCLSADLQARVILCHITRRVSEETIIADASAAGLVLCTNPEHALCPEGPYRMLSFAPAEPACLP